MCSLQIEAVIDRERDDTRNQLQESDVFGAVGSTCVADNAQRAQPAVRGCKRNANGRTQILVIRSLGGKQLFQARKAVSLVRICYVQRFLAVENAPTGQFLYGQFRLWQWTLAPGVPLDLVRAFLEDGNVEMIKRKKVIELTGENRRQLLRFTTF